MEISSNDVDAIGPQGGSQWYSSQGIGANGQSVTLNFLVNSEDEVAPLAHGLGVAQNIHMHAKATRIGTRKEYEEMSRPT